MKHIRTAHALVAQGPARLTVHSTSTLPRRRASISHAKSSIGVVQLSFLINVIVLSIFILRGLVAMVAAVGGDARAAHIHSRAIYIRPHHNVIVGMTATIFTSNIRLEFVKTTMTYSLKTATHKPSWGVKIRVANAHSCCGQ
jgi:hypothetical protein